MKHKTTRRKFYKKWLHKVTIYMPPAGLLRYNKIKDLILLINDLTLSDYKNYRYRSLPLWKDQFLELLSMIENQNVDLYAKRIQGENIDFYSNDKKFIDALVNQFKDLIITIYNPDPNDYDIFNDNEKNVIKVKKLPDDCYNYRVYLKPHKLKNDPEGKQSYISWIKSQESRIKLSEAVEDWFLRTEWNWDRRYVLVDQESTLMLLKLRNPEVCGSVYRFIIS